MNSDFPGDLGWNSLVFRTAGFLLSALVVVLLFYVSTIGELLPVVLRREESSHGVFVPLLSLYFLWRKRADLKTIKVAYGVIPGLALVTGGLLVLLLSKAYGSFYWECFSLMILMAGSVVVFFGTGMLREVWFPVLFLALMIPIPRGLYDTMVDWVREGAITASVRVAGLMGVPLLRNGLFIGLPNASLHIDVGCSGIRYLLSYFTFGLAYSYLYRERTSQRILIVALTLPTSLLASTFRLTAIVILTYYVGPHMAEYRPHVITSWLVFVSVLVFFVGLDRWVAARRLVRSRGTCS